MKQLPILYTVLIGIITFLLGGFFGDWKASYDTNQNVRKNTVALEQAKVQIAVISGSLKNIEKSIDKIENKLDDRQN